VRPLNLERRGCRAIFFECLVTTLKPEFLRTPPLRTSGEQAGFVSAGWEQNAYQLSAIRLFTPQGRGAGVGRGLGVGSNLGVGVALGVAVGVGVAVAVGVTVAVGVDVGVGLAVAVGVGEGPCPPGNTRT